MIAVPRKAVFQKRLLPDEAEKARDNLFRYEITLHFDEVLLKRGCELATQFNRPTAYDTRHLALAECLNCEFWTADERPFNAVQGAFPQVYRVGNRCSPDAPSE